MDFTHRSNFQEEERVNTGLSGSKEETMFNGTEKKNSQEMLEEGRLKEKRHVHQ